MSSHPTSDLDQLACLAAELAEGPAPGSVADAIEQAQVLYGIIDRLEAAAATRVQAVDSSGAAKAEGYPSTTAWLRRSCDMLGSRASERVAVARQLQRLPETAARFTAGTLGYSSVAVISRVAKNLTDEDTVKAEPILLDTADELGPDDVAVVGRKIHDVLHPDGNLPDQDRQFTRRWFSLSGLLEGGARPDGYFDPELANMLRAALDPLAKPAGADDTRTTGQRYADALYTLLGSKQQTHMSVHVHLDTLTGGTVPGTWPDGSPVPPADVRRIAFNAGISRVIVGPDSLPLDVGREQRLATAGQRKAVEVRDRQCVVEGCTIPAAWCELDHITPWTLGGRTDLRNLALCCPFHNKYKNRHPDRVDILRHPDGKVSYRIRRRNGLGNYRDLRDTPGRQDSQRSRDTPNVRARDGPGTEAA